MHHARVAAFVLGCWIAGGFFMASVATQNFATVDGLLDSPPPQASKMIDTLGHDTARQLLRLLASEENRLYFQSWEMAQLVLGILLTSVLLFGLQNRLLASLAGILLVVTLVEHFTITQEIVSLGRSIDFVPRTVESAARSQFGKLHAMYGGIEIVKLLIAIVIAGFLFTRREGVGSSVEVQPVDYAHHRHIDG